MNIYCILKKGRNIVYLCQVDNKEEPGACERVVELVIVLPMSALDHLEYLLLLVIFASANKIFNNNNSTHLKCPV